MYKLWKCGGFFYIIIISLVSLCTFICFIRTKLLLNNSCHSILREQNSKEQRKFYIIVLFTPLSSYCFLCTTAAMQLFISLYIHGMSIKSGLNSWSLIQCFKKLAFFYRFNEKCAHVAHIFTRNRIMLACKRNNAWQIQYFLNIQIKR